MARLVWQCQQALLNKAVPSRTRGGWKGSRCSRWYSPADVVHARAWDEVLGGNELPLWRFVLASAVSFTSITWHLGERVGIRSTRSRHQPTRSHAWIGHSIPGYQTRMPPHSLVSSCTRLGQALSVHDIRDAPEERIDRYKNRSIISTIPFHNYTRTDHMITSVCCPSRKSRRKW